MVRLQWNDLIHRLYYHATTGLVLGFLCGLMVLGHRYDWKLPQPNEAHAEKKQSKPTPATNEQRSADGEAPDSPRATRLQLASRAALAKTPVRLRAVEHADMPVYLRAGGSIQYDKTRLAQLSPRAAGIVWEVLVKVGDVVQQGDPLALIESPDVGKAKTDYLQAIVQNELKEKLTAGAREVEAVLPPRRVLELESALREARLQKITAEQALSNLGLAVQPGTFRGLSDEQVMARLRTLGLPESLATRLAVAPAIANLISLRAPFAGRVIGLDLVKGEAVSAGQPRITLADTQTMWVILEVAADDAAKLRPGQELLFQPDGLGTLELKSEVAWISSEADVKTRRVQVRAAVHNAGGMLRAHTFGAGRIKVHTEPGALAVAAESLHWDLDQQAHLLFVSLDEQTFEARPVRVGARHGRRAEVTPLRPGELRAGERVAAEGSYLLKSELLRQRLTTSR